MDRLRRMEIFLAVADAGKFTKAAETLGLSKSAVSHAVNALEEHLGTRLINRNNRTVQLTDVGRSYLERCRAVILDVDELEDAARSLQGRVQGRINLNASASFGINKLAPVVAGFLRIYPDTEISLQLTERIVDLVEEGGDVAIRLGKRLADSALISRRLGTSTMQLCASPAYLENNGRPDVLADLRDHNCLRYSLASTPKWHFLNEQKKVSVNPMGSFESNNGDVLKLAALEGVGVTYLPDFVVADNLADGSLQAILPQYTGTELDIYAIYPPNRHLSARIRAIVDFFAATFN